MTCTTFLHNSELNLPLPYPEVKEVLDDVRKVTKLDWQIVPLTITKKTWYGKVTHEIFYGLYVTIEEIAAYLMGTLNGADFFVRCMENKK